MKAGFAKRDITPEIGGHMEGFGPDRFSESVHDRLFARAIYTEDKGEKALIISYDLLFFMRDQVDRIKGAIGHQLNMSPSQILLNTSHTHASPHVTNWYYRGYPERQAVDVWVEASVDAAKEAASSAQDASLSATRATTQIPVSRRKPNGAGGVDWAPDKEGEVCRELPVCLFKSPQGEVIAGIVSISCHPSIVHGPHLSAEYPGAAVDSLNRHYATEGFMFLQGAAGDSKPVQVADENESGRPYWRSGDWEDVKATGEMLSAEVIAAVEHGLVDVSSEIKCRLQGVDWPYESLPSRKELEKEIASENSGDERRKVWAQDQLNLLQTKGEFPTSLNVTTQILQLGPELRFVAIEGEIVAGIGNEILKLFDSGITFPLGYSNGCKAYLTTPSMREEEGYEVESFWEYGLPGVLDAKGSDEIYAYINEQKRTL